jgi:hypothetical protein
VSGPWERYAAPESGPWAKYAVPEEPPTSAPRLVGQVAQNTNDAIASTVGAPVDLVAAGLRQVGVPVDKPFGGSESIKSGIDYVATLPGRVSDAVSQRSMGPLTEDRTSRFAPQNLSEKIAAGVGQGVGTVASTLLPAGAIARTATPTIAAQVQPLAGGTARVAGQMGVSVASPTMTQGLAKTLASQPVTQLASGVAGGATTGATDSPMLGLLASLAVPVGASIGRGIISPTTNTLSEAEKRIVETARREGVPLTPSQETGSKTLRTLEETMAKLPLSGGPMNKTYDKQRAALNEAIMARTGTAAKDASPETLTQVAKTLGGQFDDLAARTTLKPDQRFADDVLKVATDYGRRLETDVAPVFKSYMDDLQPVIDAVAAGQNPAIAGETYKQIRSDLARRVRSTSNGELKQALSALGTALDDAVERSASPDLLKEWQTLRKQYAAYKTVDKAMATGRQADRVTGDVPLGAFSSAVRAGDREGFARARGQYGELSKLADFLAPKIPDSGTATRGVTANLLSGGALAAGAGGLGASMGTAAAAAAAPWLTSLAYNTPAARAYLTNQIAGRTDLAGLYGAEALRRAIESSRGEGEPTALARAMMQANERRAGAAR